MERKRFFRRADRGGPSPDGERVPAAGGWALPRRRSTGGKTRYGDLGVFELRELRSLRQENTKLKHLVADLTLDRTVLQETIREKL